MASNPESEKWRTEAECYRLLYGQYHALFNLVGPGERERAISLYQAILVVKKREDLEAILAACERVKKEFPST